MKYNQFIQKEQIASTINLSIGTLALSKIKFAKTLGH